MLSIQRSSQSSPLWWYDHRSDLDLAPPYQRKSGIWSVPDQALLLDSVVNGYDVPKFYVADFTGRDTTLNLKRRPFAVIDGKQRFQALFDFFAGSLKLANDFVLLEDLSRPLAGKTYQDLLAEDPDIAGRVARYELVVMSVATDDEANINQLFVRLNRGLPLVGAEIRNAMLGRFPGLIRKLVQEEFFHSFISFSTKRGQDLNAAGKLVLVEYNGELVATKRKSLDLLTEELVQAEAGKFVPRTNALTDIERATDRVRAVLHAMTVLFTAKDPLLRSPGQLTVYYWLVRELGVERAQGLPEFLTEFERMRAANRRVMAKLDNLELVDRELARFDYLNRNTNDQESLRGRFEILYRRFVGQTS